MRDINVNIYGDINLSIPDFDDFVEAEDEFSDEEMFEEAEDEAGKDEQEEDVTEELRAFYYAFLRECEANGLIKVADGRIKWNVKEGR